MLVMSCSSINTNANFTVHVIITTIVMLSLLLGQRQHEAVIIQTIPKDDISIVGKLEVN